MSYGIAPRPIIPLPKANSGFLPVRGQVTETRANVPQGFVVVEIVMALQCDGFRYAGADKVDPTATTTAEIKIGIGRIDAPGEIAVALKVYACVGGQAVILEVHCVATLVDNAAASD